jgi:AraC-like DNA-binding protein
VRRSDYQNLAPGDRATVADKAIARRLVLRRLWTGLGIEVVTTAWQRELHAERSECRPEYAAIEIMRTGCFEKRVGRERLIADAGMVVFHDPGETFEIRHPCGSGNRGTTLRISAVALEDGERPARFRARCAPSPAEFALATQRLMRGLALDDAEALACEEAVVTLVEAAFALDARGSEASATSGAAHARARAVQAFLNESFAQPLRLGDVARGAGCSVWHVCRQFRVATGSTIHAWLARLRLRYALEALHDGAQDLTRLALDAGFSSHSHFAASFRAEFGVTPGVVRAELGPRR